MTEDDPGGPLDLSALEVIGRRVGTHPLVTGWTFEPDAVSPRRLEIRLDAAQYPASVDRARLDVRWFEGGTYTVHYVESRGTDTCQCRWDRHPKPDGPTAHFHPPPDASADVVASDVRDDHPLDVAFAVLAWVEARVEAFHDRG